MHIFKKYFKRKSIRMQISMRIMQFPICMDFLFDILKFEQVEKAHDADLHCVDWNHHDINFILTG